MLYAPLLVAGVLCASCADDEKNQPRDMVVTFEGAYWQRLIDTPQSGGPLLYGPTARDYAWKDEATTLSGGMTNEWGGDYGYAEGGTAISNYITPPGSDYTPDDTHQLEVARGNGSATFAVVYNHAMLRFADGRARLVRSMDVCPTSYVAFVAREGISYARALTRPDDFLTIHIKADSGAALDVPLVSGGKLAEGWQRADLSPLGRVKELTFSISGSDTGDYGLNTPAYFALDNIVVAP